MYSDPLVLPRFLTCLASQVSELRQLLQGEEEEEEEEEGAGGVEAPEEMMVFQADEEGQPAYEPPPKKEVSGLRHGSIVLVFGLACRAGHL